MLIWPDWYPCKTRAEAPNSGVPAWLSCASRATHSLLSGPHWLLPAAPELLSSSQYSLSLCLDDNHCPAIGSQPSCCFSRKAFPYPNQVRCPPSLTLLLHSSYYSCNQMIIGAIICLMLALCPWMSCLWGQGPCRCSQCCDPHDTTLVSLCGDTECIF